MFALCGPSEAEELGAQMAVDLIEAAGFDICFAGGGIANDEVLGRVHEESPDVLLMFSSAAQDLPNIRAMIDQLHEIGACPNLQIAVGGGVFNRAEGLAEEIGADVYGTSPLEMVDILIHDAEGRAGLAQRTVGRNRVKAQPPDVRILNGLHPDHGLRTARGGEPRAFSCVQVLDGDGPRGSVRLGGHPRWRAGGVAGGRLSGR